MKKIVSFVAALVCTLNICASASPRDIVNHWAGNAINSMIASGVLQGYDDGTFKPNNPITREEAAVLFYRFINVKNPEIAYMDKGFMNYWIADVPSDHWSAEAVKYFVSNGIMDVDGYGAFDPKRDITRSEVAKLICSYSIDHYPIHYWPTFYDTDSDYISVVAGQKILSGYDDGTFRPHETIKRGELADCLYSISDFPLVPVEYTLPDKHVIDVPYISQLYPVYAVVGCEPTSLLMGLKAKGYAQNVDLRTFLDNMPKTSSNPAKGFVGSPYQADPTKKTRTTIYPPVLSAYASQYGNVSDFSGSSPEDIQAEVLSGNPVVAYCTMYWEAPFYRYYDIEGTTQRLLSNNHVILVCGYDSNTDQYYIADPYNENNTKAPYFYWIDASVFEPIYNERRHAIVVR